MQKNLGFTIIEFMIVIIVIGVLAGILIPSAMRFLPNMRVKAAARTLYSDMQKAKIEAIKTNQAVMISFVDGAYAPGGGIGSYQVFVDTNGNGSYTAGETILSQESMPNNVTLYSNSFTGDITGFNSRGLPIGNSGVVQFRNNYSRYYQVSLSKAGGMKIKMSSDGVTWN